MTHLHVIFAGRPIEGSSVGANAHLTVGPCRDFCLRAFPGGTYRVSRNIRQIGWFISLPILLLCSLTLSGCGSYTVRNAVSEPAGATLSGFTCSPAVMTGAGTEACTVTLTAAAGTGGLTVSLSTDSTVVALPASVTVPAGARSAGFTATVSAFSSAQKVTQTATADGTAKTDTVTLNVAAPELTLGSASVPFGNVDLNTPATLSVTLTSAGSGALTISSGKVTGTGFSMSGMSFPATLNPGQTETLDIEFDPTTSGPTTGTVTLTSNSASGGTETISLTGTGQVAAYQVNLTWDAPTNSPDPVAGYLIYRAISGSSAYQLLNSSLEALTAYTDLTVQSGTSYVYYVESVDAEWNQSVPSNTYTVNVP